VVRVEGINCGGAVADIEKALQAKKGVAAVEVNTYDGRVVVGYDSKTIQSEAIASSIAGLGYAVYSAEALSLDRFRAMTGREPGAAPGSVGCGGACGVRK
jgi:copper chaperone CopZ